MPSPIESPLNPNPALRYDDGHEVEFAEARPPADHSSPPQAGADMDVKGLGSIQSASLYRASRTSTTPPKPAESRALNPKDTVEISAAARAAETSAKPSLRAERLSRIKAEIDAGTYDTPERLEAALERMFAMHGIGDD